MDSKIELGGLTNDENAKLQALINQRQAKLTRNLLRERYFDSKQTTRMLGIAIPPSMARLSTVLEWPEKACIILNRRLHLDKFVVPGQTAPDGPFELNSILDGNRFELESRMTHLSAMKYGPAFVAVTQGDTQAGEPEVLFSMRSALHMTALWDYRRRQISAALSIIDEDANGVKEFVLYLPDVVVTARKFGSNVWRADFRGHTLGRVPVAILPYQPDLDRPFGRSRISRTVMSLTDQAVRTLVRTEVGAEFYNTPQRYALGAGEKAFTNPDGSLRTGWEVTIGKLLALDLNEQNQAPVVGQFPQMTMEPNNAQLRMIATLFAGATDISVSSLGIIHDQPASAEAMETSHLDLVLNAEEAQPIFGHGWLDMARMALQIRDNLSAPTKEMLRMRTSWRNAATPSRQSVSQAVVQEVGAGILPPDSDVTLEQLGYDETTIQRIQADRRRAQAGSRVAELVAAARGVRGAIEGPAGAAPAAVPPAAEVVAPGA